MQSSNHGFRRLVVLIVAVESGVFAFRFAQFKFFAHVLVRFGNVREGNDGVEIGDLAWGELGCCELRRVMVPLWNNQLRR